MVQRLNQMNQSLNTASDTPKLRQDMKQIRESMKTLIKQIAGMLDTTPAEYERGDHQRVVQLFGNTVSQCKEAIQTGLQKESAFPSRDAFTQTYGNEGRSCPLIPGGWS